METLDLPTIDASAVATTEGHAIDLTKIDLNDVALAQFGDWRKDLADAKKRVTNVEWNESTAKGLADIKDVRHKVTRKPQAEANKTADALVSKLTRVSKAVRAEQVLIVDAYKAVEAPLTEIIDKREAEIEAAAAEVLRVAELRRAGFETRVAAIRDNAAKARGISSERIAKGIALVEAIAVDASWEEFEQPAAVAKAETLAAMRTLFDAAKATEDAAAAAEAERVRLARVAEEQRVERERLAAEDARQQAARDKLAADLKAFEELRAAARREQADREAAALKAAEPEPEPEPAPPAHQEPEVEAQIAAPVASAQADPIGGPGTQAGERGRSPHVEPTVDIRPPLTTGALMDLAGEGYNITAQAIKALGFRPAANPPGKGAGVYWPASDVRSIFAALAKHFQALA